MGQITISTIQNEKLRKAAEKADSNGKNAYNGKIDSDELSVLLSEAQKNNCGMGDVMEIVNAVGVQNDDKTTLAKVSKMREINTLKGTIAGCEKRLELMKSNLEKIKPEMTYAEVGGGVVGFVGGAIAGLKVAAPLAAACASTGVGSLASPAIMIVGAIGGAVAGGYLGATAVDYASRQFESHDKTVQRKNAENYEKTQIEPMEAKIKQLKEQLKIKESEFYAL